MKKSFLDRYRERKGKPVDVRVITLTIQILSQLKLMLTGYKTYVVGTVAIIGAVAGYLTGDLSLPDTLQAVLTAILGMTVRSGVTSENAKK